MARNSLPRGLLLGVCLTLIALGCYAKFKAAFEQAQMESCSSGLLEARRTFDQFRDRHGGKYPQGLDQLDLSSATPDAFRCPKARRLGTHAYLYVRPRDGAPDDTPILLCWRHPELLALTKGGWIRRWAR